MTIERRAISLELRAVGRRLEGYAATFNTDARIGNFTETIAPGAFRASLGAGGDILALADHAPDKLLGRTRSGSLRLSEDNTGLAFSLDVPETAVGNDVLALAKRGDLGGMSFGFITPKDGDSWAGNKRTLRSVDLKEISVVSSWPAYPNTIVTARYLMPARLHLARLYLESL